MKRQGKEDNLYCHDVTVVTKQKMVAHWTRVIAIKILKCHSIS